MFRLICVTTLLGLSFAVSAEPVILRCTFISGTHSGQSGYIGFSEENGFVVVGGERISAYFSQHSIEWTATDGKSKSKLDRVTGNLYFQVRQAPFTLAANCIVSPTETRF